MALDPIDQAVISQALIAAAREMGVVLAPVSGVIHNPTLPDPSCVRPADIDHHRLAVRRSVCRATRCSSSGSAFPAFPAFLRCSPGRWRLRGGRCSHSRARGICGVLLAGVVDRAIDGSLTPLAIGFATYGTISAALVLSTRLPKRASEEARHDRESTHPPKTRKGSARSAAFSKLRTRARENCEHALVELGGIEPPSVDG